jgi:hypothetical protein
LGERGITRTAENHHCAECTQPYKSSADHISFYDPAATVGIDENVSVPQLEVNTSLIQQAQSAQSVKILCLQQVSQLLDKILGPQQVSQLLIPM